MGETSILRRSLLALPLATPALAQTLGERPVRLVVPYSAGFVAQAQPDGHPLLLEGATPITGPLTNRGLPFDYAAKPRVAQVTAAPYARSCARASPGMTWRASWPRRPASPARSPMARQASPMSAT